jgi:drug/metabolite transporter (DMT)-like permease
MRSTCCACHYNICCSVASSPSCSITINSFNKIKVYHRFCLLAAISLTESQGNFMEVIAFQSLPLEYTSILLLFTLPLSVVFSKLLLKRRYASAQYYGIIITITGVAIAIYSYSDKSFNMKFDYLYGTICALICDLLISFSNVLQEYALLDGCHNIQMLSSLGIMGLPVTLIEAIVFKEYSSLHKLYCDGRLCIAIIRDIFIIRGIRAASLYADSDIF